MHNICKWIKKHNSIPIMYVYIPIFIYIFRKLPTKQSINYLLNLVIYKSLKFDFDYNLANNNLVRKA